MSNITPAVPDPPEIEARLWSGFTHTHLAFDIGANCGQSFSHILEIANQLIAFEPSFEAVQWLEENLLFLFKDKVILQQAAISSTTGTITLYAIPGKIDTGQLVSDVKGMEWRVQGKSFGRLVTAYTLDEAIRTFRTIGTPGFIKIDVEGHEWEIFRSALHTLCFDRPQFLIEIHDEKLGTQIRNRLEDYIYNIEVIRHPNYEVDSALYRTHYWIKAFPDAY